MNFANFLFLFIFFKFFSRTATFLPTPIHPNIQHEESGDNQDGNVGDTGETEENVELNDADMEMVQRALAAPLSDEYTLRDF